MSPVPPSVALLRITGHVMLARCIGIVAELGIADLVEASPMTTIELAAHTKSHAGALYRTLRYLASHNIFAEDGAGRFSNTATRWTLSSPTPAPSM